LPALLNHQHYIRTIAISTCSAASRGVSNLPIRAKLRDYKWDCPNALSFFHAGDRTEMTTKEGRRLKET
jgi:hypothetical protein